MAVKNDVLADPERPATMKLPPEIVATLKSQEVDVVRARKDIQTLKKLGLETKVLEDKLDWADEARKVMLKEFA